MKLPLTTDDLIETVRNHMKREEQLELDSMWLVTLLDQLRQISDLITEAINDRVDISYAMDARTRLDRLRVRISKDLRQLQEQEQYDETPSRESVYP